MSDVRVNASTGYNIVIKNGLLKDIGAHISAFSKPVKVMIITDSNVDKLYSDNITKALKPFKFDVYNFVFKAGEGSKNFKTYMQAVSALNQNNFSKSDIIIGFGGGVACDLAGFVAATYLRGLRLVMVPTSLLCDVDASVGGKNAVDYEKIKNQVGTIYQPLSVLIDPQLLKTLPEKIFNDGMAEVIKYAIIDNMVVGKYKFFDLLESQNIEKSLEDIITASVAIKAKIVEDDEFDTGKRHILNLGHTFGHALEFASGYKMSHGVAVANGIDIICRYSVKSSKMDRSEYERIIKLLKKFSLIKKIKYTPHELESSLVHDKKIRGKNINLIVPYGIGDVRIDKTECSKLSSILKTSLQEI